jgi:hypothetical protein
MMAVAVSPLAIDDAKAPERNWEVLKFECNETQYLLPIIIGGRGL